MSLLWTRSQPIVLFPSSLNGLLATRYLTLAGLTLLLWDHCLTFEQEKRLIWPSRAKFVKWALLGNRYVVEVVMIISAHALSGISSRGLSDTLSGNLINLQSMHFSLYKSSCRAWVMTIICLAVFSMAVSHGILVLKLWKLWDARRTVMLITTVAFVITETASMIAAAITAHEVFPNAIFRPDLNSCALNDRPPTLKVIWAFLVAFELFAFLMVVFNGFSRPRGRNDFLLKTLFRDGIYFFSAISVLGWMNLILSIEAPVAAAELGIFFIWAVCVTIVMRMMLNLREAEIEKSELPIQM